MLEQLGADVSIKETQTTLINQGVHMGTRHTINADEMVAYLAGYWFQYAAHFGEFSAKRLEVSFSGLYRVTDHGKVTYEGPNRDAAIEAYNTGL